MHVILRLTDVDNHLSHENKTRNFFNFLESKVIRSNINNVLLQIIIIVNYKLELSKFIILNLIIIINLKLILI